MTYSAELIEAVKTANGFTTDHEVAKAIGVSRATLSEWKKAKRSPMPESRVLELCTMANITEPGPWLIAIHAEAMIVKSGHHGAVAV